MEEEAKAAKADAKAEAKAKKKNNKKKKKDEEREIPADGINYSINYSIDPAIQLKAIQISLKQNWFFYIVLLCCIYAFTQCRYNKSSFVWATVSVVVVSFYGYLVHFYSHYMKLKLTEFYNTYNNIFTRNKYIDWFIRQFIDFGEFHAKTHHDSDINKQVQNVIYEFVNNAITQGLSLIVLKKLLDLIDNRVIVLWALFYATVHNFNYYFVKPITHKEHHLDDRTNYGIDIWDIIVGSKYDWTHIESHNHAAINLGVLTAIIMYVCQKMKW
jgi:hypothetical protein